MAQLKIPLNKFRSKFVALSAGAGVTRIYSTPENRATIVIAAQTTNITNMDRTVSVGVSSTGTIDNPVPRFYYLVKDFPIPANDARSVISGRIVLQGADNDQILSPEVLFAEDTTDYIKEDIVSFNGLTIDGLKSIFTFTYNVTSILNNVTAGTQLVGYVADNNTTLPFTVLERSTITGNITGNNNFGYTVPGPISNGGHVILSTVVAGTTGLMLNLGLLETINTN